ncbi:MAG: hypothetical protein LKE92_10070 [Atopobiaceae bacterium]|nr:hypothetical protein [Atopobium sp.]MCH4082441.1 hypothetical protein [Atopobiaceae bacterium]MCI1498196.1 hypothetical protein [Atopobiaceae bacterium]MCI1539996.1 hypothetical protein [Atopobiaceae bacterium]
MLKLLKGIAYITPIVLLFPILLLYFLVRGRGKPKACGKRLRTGGMPIWMQMAVCWPAMDMTRGFWPLCQNLTISGKVLTAHAAGSLGWLLPFC